MVNRVAQGTRWRYAVTTWLRGLGHAVTVTPNGEKGDDLDVRAGRLRLSVECKDHGRFDLPGWLAQAHGNAGRRLPVVFVKRRGRAGAEHGYVVMDGDTFATLLADNADLLGLLRLRSAALDRVVSSRSGGTDG